jgi:hypothetical protein
VTLYRVIEKIITATWQPLNTKNGHYQQMTTVLPQIPHPNLYVTSVTNAIKKELGYGDTIKHAIQFKTQATILLLIKN